MGGVYALADFEKDAYWGQRIVARAGNFMRGLFGRGAQAAEGAAGGAAAAAPVAQAAAGGAAAAAPVAQAAVAPAVQTAARTQGAAAARSSLSIAPTQGLQSSEGGWGAMEKAVSRDLKRTTPADMAAVQKNQSLGNAWTPSGAHREQLKNVGPALPQQGPVQQATQAPWLERATQFAQQHPLGVAGGALALGAGGMYAGKPERPWYSPVSSALGM